MLPMGECVIVSLSYVSELSTKVPRALEMGQKKVMLFFNLLEPLLQIKNVDDNLKILKYVEFTLIDSKRWFYFRITVPLNFHILLS